MRKKIIVAVLILLFLLIAAQVIIAPHKGTISYTLEGNEYMLLIAKTPQEWEKGLMGISELNNADGMVFLFPDKRVRTFWNKKTYLDLDIYWIKDNKVVGKSFLPSIEKGAVTVTSPSKVNKVIEVVRN
jgi:uncharacterized membrane protein (UPF0127 family)